MGQLLLRAAPLLLLAAACATTGAGRRLTQEEALAQAPTDIAKGKVLYERNCARCHALYMPRSYTADEWRYYVKKYGRKSRLSKPHRGLVYRYLEEHSAE